MGRERAYNFSGQTEAVLRAAGWFPGRRDTTRVARWRERMATSDGFVMTSAAQDALEEFGGISINVRGPGLDFARTSFEIDPELAIGEADRFRRHEQELGRLLFPLGEVEHGHAFLAIDGIGHVYILGDDLVLVADNIHSALEHLAMGKSCNDPAS